MHIPVRRNQIAIVHDALMAALSFPLALWLRLGDITLTHSAHYLWQGTVGFTLIFIVIASIFKLPYSVWRYVSLLEMMNIVKVSVLSIIVFYVCLFIWNRLEMVPRSAPEIHVLLFVFMLATPRILYRTFREHKIGLSTAAVRQSIPVLVVGYKDAAEAFVRTMQRTEDPLYRVVGLIDEDKSQRGRMVHGIRIMGGIADIKRIVSKLELKGSKPQKVILSEDYLDAERIELLLAQCEATGLTMARLPRVNDLRSGGASVAAQLQPIAIEDLLGRAQNTHEREAMRLFLTQKTVLITGAGGSIGSEMCRQVAACAPERIILVELSEFNLYSIEHELVQLYPDMEIVPILADIRNGEHITHIMRSYKPQIVFHAAAIKHVPLSEANPLAAISTNVLGTRNVAHAAKEAEVQMMVMISTDKAVNPTNVMGASKRLAERYIQAYAAGQSTTRYMMVRFGNVLGSTGSVVPLFQKQLQQGGPLTVTHPDMVRYFMTIREAVELVIQAAVKGSGMEGNGLIFVLDMGRPVKIADLAEKMIRLAGLRLGEDIEIKYTGLRPGEKLYEELFYNSEELVKTSHQSIMLAKASVHVWDELVRGIDQIERDALAQDSERALAMLRELVPDYTQAA
jgi:FlaA1/EpsC-like NDP-sugar epimerase